MKTAIAFIVTLIAYTLCNNAQAANSNCDWNNPGANRFIGNHANAIDNYTDIPVSIRAELKKKINAHKFDDHITIDKFGMSGKLSYSNGRDMHWGQNKMCKGEFNISQWKSTHQERAVVYTYSGYSIAIPSVCGNVFRLTVAGGSSSGTSGSSNNTTVHAETTTAETVPYGGGTTTNDPDNENATVDWPSSHPKQNSVVPSQERDFMPVPPMPVTPAFFFVVPQNTIPVVLIPELPVIPAVPEPATYALMLLGLCLVIGLASRRK